MEKRLVKINMQTTAKQSNVCNRSQRSSQKIIPKSQKVTYITKDLPRNSLLLKKPKIKEMSARKQKTLDPVELQKKNKQLQKNLELSQFHQIQRENQFKTIQSKSIEKQQEYQGYIKNLRNQLFSKSYLNDKEKHQLENINSLYGQVVSNVENQHAKQVSLMINQERKHQRFFLQEVRKVKDKMDEELLAKKEDDKNFIEKEAKLEGQLNEIKTVAFTIDKENVKLFKANQQLRLQNQTLEKENSYLGVSVIKKKKKIAVMKYIIQTERSQKSANYADQSTNHNFSNLNKQSSKNYNSILQESQLKTDTSRDLPLPKLKLNSINKQDFERYNNHEYNYLKDNLQKEKTKNIKLEQELVREKKEKNEVYLFLKSLVDHNKFNIDSLAYKSLQDRQAEQTEFLKDSIEKLIENDKVLKIVQDKVFYNKKHF